MSFHWKEPSERDWEQPFLAPPPSLCSIYTAWLTSLHATDLPLFSHRGYGEPFILRSIYLSGYFDISKFMWFFLVFLTNRSFSFRRFWWSLTRRDVRSNQVLCSLWSINYDNSLVVNVSCVLFCRYSSHFSKLKYSLLFDKQLFVRAEILELKV